MGLACFNRYRETGEIGSWTWFPVQAWWDITVITVPWTQFCPVKGYCWPSVWPDMARYGQSGRCAEVYFDLWHQNMEVASPNWLQGSEAAGWGWCAQAICTKDMILLFLSDMMWYVICSFFAQLLKGKIQHIFRSWFSILFTSAFTQNVGRITSAVTLILSSSPVGHLFRDRGWLRAGLRWIVGIRGPSNTQWLVAVLSREP